ncbi:FecR family protein [Chitinophaga sp.]|uniref:FecR family protein n=1 Tax=Chitinophaga sp. TaxID=1869181 RepID=UPI002F946D0E
MNFFQQIFRRYQQHQSDEQEQELVNRWYDATGNARRPAWMSKQHIRKTKADTWEKIVAGVGLEQSPDWNAPASGVNHLRLVVRYAAAAMVVGLGLWGILQWLMPSTAAPNLMVQVDTYSTARGVRKYLQLADGTEVWLNNGSVLSVRKMGIEDPIREVWLSEGEAYFEVAKNPAKPFIIHVDALQTKVLGTAFNIRAYRELPQVQITVTAGKVQVVSSGRVLDTLTRNMQLDYELLNGRFTSSEKNVSSQNSWWNNRFVLDNAPFEELALRMKLQYNIIVVSNNPRIQQSAFTANFPQHASKESVLATLCTLYTTRYTVKKDTIIIH